MNKYGTTIQMKKQKSTVAQKTSEFPFPMMCAQECAKGETDRTGPP